MAESTKFVGIITNVKQGNVITHFIQTLRNFKKILIVSLIISLLGFLIIDDLFDRNVYYSKIKIDKEFKENNLLTDDEKIKLYERNFGNAKYNFPRKKVSLIRLYENKLLIGRLTYKNVNETEKKELITFFNNPQNFDWGQTTWSLRESEYILKFYDENNSEVGKIWLCLEDCGMTSSIPFSPNMKYGGLSQNGRKKIQLIIKKINS